MVEGDSKYDPIKHKHILAQSNGMFILVLLIACLFEADLILRLWIRPRHSIDALSAFLVQFGVLLPAFAILSLRFGIGKQMKTGQISPAFAKELSLQLAVLLLLVFAAFAQFLNYGPR
ncbi:MAG: hypothetical protein ABSE51_10910 [Terracidiphilus sp.]|jgi:hypothetical protein